MGWTLAPLGAGLLVCVLLGWVPVSAAAALALLGVAGAAWGAQRDDAPHPVPAARAAPPTPGTAVLDALPDPVMVVDGGRRLVAANRAARRTFGVRGPGADLSLSLRHPAVLRAVSEALAESARRQADVDLPVPVARSFQLSVIPFDGSSGSPEGAVLVLHDVTAIRRAEQMRADFVANVSHELRTPLASLAGFIETLEGPAREDPEARERFLSIMRGEAERMGRIIDDLLSLARVEVNEHVPPASRADLSAILRRVAELLEMRAAERGMRIVLDLPDDVPEAVGDPDQLIQVFQNLVDNAIKYGRTGTGIAVRARAGDHLPGDGRAPAVSVSVSDRGEGIDPEDVPRLTERFYRVDKARSRSLGGTGLGLAIVKHIVSRHRGRLHIDSRRGEGSTFTVVLPAAEPAVPRPPASATAGTGDAGGVGVTKP